MDSTDINHCVHPLIDAFVDELIPIIRQFDDGSWERALAMGMGSASLETAFKERPHFGSGLNAVAPQGIIPVGGGVLVRNKRGDIIGAVGITGDTSDNDTACAVAGIEAAGLVADPG